jgi:hypothetical protein
MQPDDVVHLASAANPTEAHLWQQVLQAEGVRCQAVGDYLDAGIGDLPGLRAEVWVQRKDLERARAILASYRQTAAKGTEPDET